MKILVTGGSGFIGSHLTERLLEEGNEVIVIDDLSTGRDSNLKQARRNARLTILQQDLANSALVNEVVERVDAVYHLAAAVGVSLIAKNPIETIHRNIYPTQLILDALCSQRKLGRHVPMFLASTSEVYGKNPKSTWNEEDDLVFGSTSKPRWSYGASKAIDEFLALACARQFSTPIVIGRFFNVVGPRQSGAYGMVLPRFVESAIRGGPIIVHDDGLQERCFAHVQDVISAVIQLMAMPTSFGKVFNIGSDVSISVLGLAERVRSIVNPSATIEFQSYADAYDPDFEDVRRRVPDLSRLKEQVGFCPQTDLDTIIRDVWQFLLREQVSNSTPSA